MRVIKVCLVLKDNQSNSRSSNTGEPDTMQGKVEIQAISSLSQIFMDKFSKTHR